MNWEVAGSVAEVVGAVAVVVSIIYLARQVTHANRTAEAATTLEVSRLLAEWHGRLNQTPELAYIFIHGTSDSSEFSEVEKARFLATVAELFLVLEGLYRQHLLGYVSDATWKPLELFLARIASSPNVRPWWDSKISMNGEDFREYVD
jgi:hypothetical protein